MELVWGRSFLMWRTDWGKNFIEKVSQKNCLLAKSWRCLGSNCFFIMIFMFLLLLWQATLAWQIPKSASVSPKMMIGLPGIKPCNSFVVWYFSISNRYGSS